MLLPAASAKPHDGDHKDAPSHDGDDEARREKHDHEGARGHERRDDRVPPGASEPTHPTDSPTTPTQPPAAVPPARDDDSGSPKPAPRSDAPPLPDPPESPSLSVPVVAVPAADPASPTEESSPPGGGGTSPAPEIRPGDGAEAAQPGSPIDAFALVVPINPSSNADAPGFLPERPAAEAVQALPIPGEGFDLWRALLVVGGLGLVAGGTGFAGYRVYGRRRTSTTSVAVTQWTVPLSETDPLVPRRASRPSPRPIAAAPSIAPSLATLVQRARENPNDGLAHFVLGAELFEAGDHEKSLRHLERSFRLAPELVLRLLNDPKYGPVRNDDEVRRILKRFHRDLQRRIFTGYA